MGAETKIWVRVLRTFTAGADLGVLQNPSISESVGHLSGHHSEKNVS